MDENIDYKTLLEDGAILVDVRSDAEYATGYLPDAVSLPMNSNFESAAQELIDGGKVLILYCVTGARSFAAKKRLMEFGAKEVYNLGSFRNYEPQVERK
jgi:phage shock protein E